MFQRLSFPLNWLTHANRTCATFLLPLLLCLAFIPCAYSDELEHFSFEPIDEQPAPLASEGAIMGETGFGQIDEDFFLNFDLRLNFSLPVTKAGCPDEEFCLTRLHLGLQAPLRFRVIDRAPYQDSVLRKEDWATFSDYLRIIRFVEYGYPHEPFYGRLGELGSATLGHGTIINGYYNVITTDHYQLGFQGNINTIYGGVETLINNLVQPSVFGFRSHIRPWGWIDPMHWMHRFAVGTSLVADISAPTMLQQTPTGEIVVGPDARPMVETTTLTSIAGIDLEYELLRSASARLTPYVDFNHHFQLGSGFHSGMLMHFYPISTVGLSTRLEYRALGSRYLPDYIGPIYEIERYHYIGWNHQIPAPKLRAARSQPEGVSHGVYAAASADFLRLFTASMAYENYQGPRNSALRLRVSVHPDQRFQLGVFYYKQNFDTMSDVFDLDGAMMVTEARIPVASFLYLRGHYSRLWRLNEFGEYSTVNDWNLGIGSAFSF